MIGLEAIIFPPEKAAVSRVLLTAFEPYDRWSENASWLALVDLTRWYEGPAEIVTRRYPVDLAAMSERLRKDLQDGFDLTIHVGQAPGAAAIRLESVGLNLRGDGSPIIPDAPDAIRTRLSLEPACQKLRSAGIPATVSHHAGTFLCNAALFLSQYYADTMGLPNRTAFVHVPVAPTQVAHDREPRPSMSTPMVSAALALLIESLASARPQST